MMSAAAIAAGGRGLALFWRQAWPEAERLVEKGIAQSGGQLDAAEFVVREARSLPDGGVLQAVVAVRGKENRRAVMLGDDGNVRRRCGTCGALARMAKLRLHGRKTACCWCTSDRRCGRRKMSFTWFGRALHPWRTRMASSWSSPQIGTLVFDVPRTAPQTLDMQMRIELEHALTLTHIAVETTPLGATLTISYQPGERLKAAMPEFDVEDGAAAWSTGAERCRVRATPRRDIPSASTQIRLTACRIR